ncbi:hypothetical protein GCM10010499_21460 [Streptomyces thermoviolaceus subsp. apingens]|nr:hypothetical protein GCM10010499_21460 [Streptomyces thermoviolaceus subsp. apingens]
MMRSAASWTTASGPLQDDFAAHTVPDSQLDLVFREFRDPVGVHGAGIVLGLEWTGNIQELCFPQERGVVLQFCQVEERSGQQSPELLPPAACPVRRHGHQGLDQLPVRAGVVGGEAAQPALAHPGETGFDVTDLDRAHPEQSRRFPGGEAGGVAESAQLGSQAQLTCCGLPPQSHRLLLPSTRHTCAHCSWADYAIGLLDMNN